MNEPEPRKKAAIRSGPPMTPEQWQNVASLVAGGVSVAAAVCLAGIANPHRSGFGTADHSAFAFWSVPFGLVVASAHAVASRVVPIDHRAALVLMVFVGPLLAIAWTFLVRLILGGWFYAFGMNVLAFWTVTGTAGLVAGWWIHRLSSLAG
jgi:hypothetical protein